MQRFLSLCLVDLVEFELVAGQKTLVGVHCRESQEASSLGGKGRRLEGLKTSTGTHLFKVPSFPNRAKLETRPLTYGPLGNIP